MSSISVILISYFNICTYYISYDYIVTFTDRVSIAVCVSYTTLVNAEILAILKTRSTRSPGNNHLGHVYSVALCQ